MQTSTLGGQMATDCFIVCSWNVIRRTAGTYTERAP